MAQHVGWFLPLLLTKKGDSYTSWCSLASRGNSKRLRQVLDVLPASKDNGHVHMSVRGPLLGNTADLYYDPAVLKPSLQLT